MTAPTPFDIRWARCEDAVEIARLFLISSDVLAAYIRARHARPGQSLEEVGAAPSWPSPLKRIPP